MKNKCSFVITKEWLDKQEACETGKQWFLSQKAICITTVTKKLITERKFNWANWTITKVMTHKQNVYYACFSAMQSIKQFEIVFPQDKHPRQAIEAALKWADNPTEENKAESAAKSAAWAVESSAESAAWAAAWAARSAESAAESAAKSAESVARSAAWAAESAAESAAWAAAWTVESARAAESAMWEKILLFGLELVLGRVLKGASHKWIK